MLNFLKISAVLVLVFLLAGCGSFQNPTASEIAGEYYYKYKSGEVEVWMLYQNLSYRQEFYRNVEDYRHRVSPTYTNTGTWSFSGNKITIMEALDSYDYLHFDRPLSQPVRLVAQLGDWFALGGETNAQIVISEDLEYILKRKNGR